MQIFSRVYLNNKIVYLFAFYLLFHDHFNLFFFGIINHYQVFYCVIYGWEVEFLTSLKLPTVCTRPWLAGWLADSWFRLKSERDNSVTSYQWCHHLGYIFKRLGDLKSHPSDLRFIFSPNIRVITFILLRCCD